MTERMENLATACAQIIEKLAGKESDLELIFKDLTLEVFGFKMKLSGTVALNVRFYQER